MSVMATNDLKHLEYSVDQEITNFFEKAVVTRSACDAYAREHLGGNAVPVPVQVSPQVPLRMETVDLARIIYSHFAPEIAFKGVIGEETEGKEPLYIYAMS
ncbi:predicted protein [Paecilomyces variotii No. 5]|uniref:Uncharacterized protein n=1 Tax=Byssochlamys spectabilis (strain No. 5 / NBRC 109023) TaxID=1356009 RepID=V5HZH1_BYSSN|nr:predicted protein [Paecilomyces variotii No. 5]